MKQLFTHFVLILAFSVTSVLANTAFLEKYIDSKSIVGEGRLTFLFWEVYDAALYAPDGKYSPNAPFALRLTYLRDVESQKIVERTLDEIKNLGFEDEAVLSRWKKQMEAVFPSVPKNESLTGIRDENMHAVFYHNDKRLGSINDPIFTRMFFDIWLSPDTSEPWLRSRLLGLSP